jgi:hypothetical protein
MKGGDVGFATKCLIGAGAVAAYLILTKRIDEVRRFEITRGTFFKSNVIFLLTATAYQYFYNESSKDKIRLEIHKTALNYRFIQNYAFMKENRKAPKFH